MNRKIGIRIEDKYVMERRVAITPEHVRKLIQNEELEVYVEPSAKRIFSDDEFKNAGAVLTSDLSAAPVIFGVKEMPNSFFEYKKTYVFFSHVIKGQPYNMPMLKAMMEKKCNLIEYEKITDDAGKRLIFFGRFAGLAGMINSLWSLGQRLKVQGIDNPFSVLKQSRFYHSLEEAKSAVSSVGEIIKKNGLPKELCPLTIGFTGYGNVSKGAQEIIDLLPIAEIRPKELLSITNQGDSNNKVIYKIVFKESDISEPKDENTAFELQHYYNHPEAYKNAFEKFLPHLSILMNCMYWDIKYPRIVTKDYLAELCAKGEKKLKVIGDITCDPDGSVECTHIGTAIEDPVFVYDPQTRKPKMGFEGEGILVMSVDILPSELPRDSSIAFGDALVKFIKPIAKANYQQPFELLDLPGPIKRALILHNGELTPDYQYVKKFL
ncbi:MAG: hypothetical protein KKG99_14315 [Bacteroidetes bacterium]|nr:hypothetical protein [Bacteroidota bacterium]